MKTQNSRRSGRFGSVFTRSYSLPHDNSLSNTIAGLSPFEKALFYGLFVTLLASFFGLFFSLNQLLLVEVPTRGGSFTEGIVGSPRFINPLLAISDADRDLTALVYSGLMKATPKGDLVPDLAERFVIENEGLSYRFFIRENARFHDNSPVTADDILFTISLAQDPTLKSPKRANWDGVRVDKINDREVVFTLTQPYSPFLENTTLGILPKHVWSETTIEQFPFSKFNVEPIGSGPYRVDSARRNASGIPISYRLAPFEDYTRGIPFISDITMRFYANEKELLEAFADGEIESVPSLSPEELGKLALRSEKTLREPLPRIFAVFFNQNKNSIFTRTEVREALTLITDRNRIIDEVLGGFGTPSWGPLPQNFIFTQAAIVQQDTAERMTRAISLLEENGWEREEESGVWIRETKNESLRFSFTLTSSNVPELKAAATQLRDQWQAFGIEVVVQLFDTNDLSQNIIRPREYEALLFGEIVGRELDLFAFWHSSQLNDPGLNIALYANITADDLLEKARETFDKRELVDIFKKFSREIENDSPAVFLYSPDFIYIVPERLKGVSLGAITTPSERFLNVSEWFIETDRVWPFFING